MSISWNSLTWAGDLPRSPLGGQGGLDSNPEEESGMSFWLGDCCGKEGRRRVLSSEPTCALGEAGEVPGRAQARHLRGCCLPHQASNHRASCLALENPKGSASKLGALPTPPGDWPEPGAQGHSLEEDEGCSVPGTGPP